MAAARFPLTVDELFEGMHLSDQVRAAARNANFSGIVSFAYALVQDFSGLKTQLNLSDFDMNQLKQRLETLGMIGGLIAVRDQRSLPAWLVNLIQESPTKAALQGRSYEEVDAWLAQRTVGCANVDAIRDVVASVWCQDRSLRLALRSHGISLKVADILERDDAFRINELHELKREHIDQLLQGSPRFSPVSTADIKALMVLYREHSTEYSGEQAASRAKVETLKAATTDAEAKVSQLLTEAKTKTPEELRQGLQSVSSSLATTAATGSLGAVPDAVNMVASSTTWATGITDKDTACKALERALKELIASNAIIQAALDRHSQDMSDEDIIAAIGSGAAFKAVAFGMSLDCISIPAPRPVLAKPEICRLMLPSSAFTSETFELSNASCATQFHSALEASGRSLSASFKVECSFDSLCKELKFSPIFFFFSS